MTDYFFILQVYNHQLQIIHLSDHLACQPIFIKYIRRMPHIDLCIEFNRYVAATSNLTLSVAAYVKIHIDIE